MGRLLFQICPQILLVFIEMYNAFYVCALAQFANFPGKHEYFIPFREIFLFVSLLVLEQWDTKQWN